MNTFERQVFQFIKHEGLLSNGDRVVIACSGGVDSMALLSFCLAIKEQMNIELIVATVDHMLRGETSLEDRQFVEAFCKREGIICEGISIDIPYLHNRFGGNLQALCRKERYAFLEDVMRKHNANKLLTAHHADDQLESLLMALMKSSLASGLQGILKRRQFAQGELIRPFLMVTKDEIGEYLQQKGLTFREDASNSKSDYLRNRIRQTIVPLLKQESSTICLHSTQVSMQLADDEQLLHQLALQSFERIVTKVGNRTYEIEIQLFQSEPVALQKRLILILLNYLYNDTNTFQSYTLCTAIINLMQSQDGSAEIHLPQGLKALRQYHSVKIGDIQHASIVEQELKLNEWNEFLGVRVFVGESSFVTAPHNDVASQYYLSSKVATFPLRVRARQSGDKMICLGMERSKKLSRIFIDEKVPLHERDDWPILVDNNNQILAILGIRVSNLFSRSKRLGDDYVVIVERL